MFTHPAGALDQHQTPNSSMGIIHCAGLPHAVLQPNLNASTALFGRYSFSIGAGYQHWRGLLLPASDWAPGFPTCWGPDAAFQATSQTMFGTHSGTFGPRLFQAQGSQVTSFPPPTCIPDFPSRGFQLASVKSSTTARLQAQATERHQHHQGFSLAAHYTVGPLTKQHTLVMIPGPSPAGKTGLPPAKLRL